MSPAERRAGGRLAAARGLRAAAELAAIARVLDGANVRWLAYKGSALALLAYGDVAARESDDIDIVVADEDARRCWSALCASGYASVHDAPWATVRAVDGWKGQTALVKPGALPIDLHWRFCDRKLPWNPAIADLYARATYVDVAGARVRTPSPDDALLLVLTHAARHGWDHIESLTCAAALLERGADARIVLDRAAPLGAARAVAAGLIAAERLAGARLPPGLSMEGPDAPKRQALAAEAAARVSAGDAGDAREARLHLRALDRARDRVRYLLLAAMEPTARDRAVVPLPRGLRWLYVPLRLVRLALRAGRPTR